MTVSAIHDRLRRATRASHERLEAIVDITRAARTPEGYRRLLAAMLGFHDPFEAALGRLDWTGAGIDLAARRKSHLIEADLATLGLARADIARLPRCADVPVPDDLPAGFGCLYVVEGATLGGRLILRQVGEDLGLGPDSGAAFYASYGPDVGRLWREFLARLAETCAGEPAAATATEAALATFAALERWLRARGFSGT